MYPRTRRTIFMLFAFISLVLILEYNEKITGYIFSTVNSYLLVIHRDVHRDITKLNTPNKMSFEEALTSSMQKNTSRIEGNMLVRKIHAHRYCLSHRNSMSGKRLGTFYLFEPKQVAYCEVPKAGCTFWKRIMRFINNDLPAVNVSKANDIDRYYTHLGPFKTTPTLKLSDKEAVKLSGMSNTFMFARDPYSRLWSAYLDKIFLPDFWHVGAIIVVSERGYAGILSRKCGHDVTFAEFVRFIVTHHSIDWHFAPVHTICDPCRTQFTFIGKQETFVDDAKYIINETGIASYLNNDIFSDRVENEIRSLTENYLNLKKAWSHSECNNKSLICDRLWKVFQINGYIGFEIPFPSNLYALKETKRLQEEFIAHAVKVHRDGRVFHEVWKKQRRQSLVEAYRTVTMEILRKFQAAYEKDFELFDYDKEPSDIYFN